MRTCTKSFLLLLLAAAPWVASEAVATTVVRVPLDELARGSDLVVQAEVTGVDVEAAPDDAHNISTTVSLAVKRVLKGHHSAPFLTLRLPGGSTRGWTLKVPGSPSFREGEEVVLFLEATSRGFRPAGLSEGKFEVTREAGKAARAKRSLNGMVVYERDQSGEILRPDGPVTHMEDDLFLNELVDIVRRAAARKGGDL